MYNECTRANALAFIRGSDEYPCLKGTVKFYSRHNSTLIVILISGLPRSATGFFGFHIHEGSNCCGEDFVNTGSHFNPYHTAHPMHAGDLPALLGCNGMAYMQVLTDRFCVEEVIGRAVIIHSDPDDFHTQPAGNAGNKIACGIIRRP